MTTSEWYPKLIILLQFLHHHAKVIEYGKTSLEEASLTDHDLRQIGGPSTQEGDGEQNQLFPVHTDEDDADSYLYGSSPGTDGGGGADVKAVSGAQAQDSPIILNSS
jgi:hypothetical protein